MLDRIDGVHMNLVLEYFLLNKLIKKVSKGIKCILWFVYMGKASAFKGYL